YHEGGGKSPLIAGDYAKNTTFENITAIDNGVGISLDDFDSDNADGTRFINCHVKNTVYREGAAFYSEGEQTGEHQAAVINCTATNKRIGAASSENARLTINGLDARLCRNAVKGLNNTYELVAKNVTAIKCGHADLVNTEVEGVYTLTGPATLINCTADSSNAKYDVVNYSALTNQTGTLRVIGGSFKKDIQVAYENGGNKYFIMQGTYLEGSIINWYNA
ncbi:hypothetical protein, partial [Larkinella ripae]